MPIEGRVCRNGESGVDVRTRNVTKCCNHHRDDQAKRERDSDESKANPRFGIAAYRPHTNEDDGESSDGF
jgi:hypothetical protein